MPQLSFESLFRPERDERVVLSVCAARTKPKTAWTLVHGTMLLVPEACAGASWPEWLDREGDSLGPRPDPPLPAETTVSGHGWALARRLLTIDEASSWLAGAWTEIEQSQRVTLPAIPEIDDLGAELQVPAALARSIPNIDSPTASLIAGLRRPIDGLLFPTEQIVPVEIPNIIKVGGSRSFTPSRDVAGIHITQTWVDPRLATAGGLLVGRAERRAWLRGGCGKGDYKTFIAKIGWEPDRIDLMDLEITHTERLGEDVVHDARLPIGELGLDDVDLSGVIDIELHSSGRRVSHELCLRTRNGVFLDCSGPYPLVEGFQVRVSIAGGEATPAVTQAPPVAPGLTARLDRSIEIEAALERIRRQAATRRILRRKEETVEQLLRQLRRARGELLIMDRFFGQAETDWAMLAELPIPIRVLTGKLLRDDEEAIVPVPVAESVSVKHRTKAPFHDRVYLWDAGGVTIGGSPTTFGQATLRLAPLSPHESEILRGEFEEHWASEHFKEVPRRAPETK
jgi:hypothetical protein